MVIWSRVAAVSLCLISQFDSVLPGSGPLAGSGSGGGAGGGSAVAGCPEPPATVSWLFEFNASDLSQTTGTFVTTWPSTGSVPGTAAGSIPTDPTYRPVFFASGFGLGQGSVQFDGVGDVNAINGTTTTAAFFHNTQTFDVVVVVRPDTTLYGSWMGSGSTGANKGVLFDLNSPAVGNACVYVLHGGGTTSNFCPISGLNPGDWTRLEFWGNGTTLFGSKNGGSALSQSAQGSVTPGNATEPLSIGASNSGNQQYPFDGAIAYLAILDRPLTGPERAAMNANLACRFPL